MDLFGKEISGLLAEIIEWIILGALKAELNKRSDIVKYSISLVNGKFSAKIETVPIELTEECLFLSEGRSETEALQRAVSLMMQTHAKRTPKEELPK